MEVLVRDLSCRQSTLDDVGPVGSAQGMRVLNEMNELDAEHEEFKWS